MNLNWTKVGFTALAVWALRPMVLHTMTCGVCWRSVVATVGFVVCCLAAMRERTKTVN